MNKIICILLILVGFSYIGFFLYSLCTDEADIVETLEIEDGCHIQLLENGTLICHIEKHRTDWMSSWGILLLIPTMLSAGVGLAFLKD